MRGLTILLICGLLVADLISYSFAAKRKSIKNPRGKRPKADCRLIKLEDCLKKLDGYRNDTNSYKLIKTSRGIDEICSNSQETLTCYTDYISKCGTPIQQDMIDFGLEQYQKSIDRFCKPGELRNDFLVHSPCVADNVLAKDNYKSTCNTPFLASVDKTDKLTNFDDRLDLICCSYNRWLDCLLDLTNTACTGAGRQALDNFLDKSFAGLSNILCKQDDFKATTERCKSLYPPKGTIIVKGKTKNPISKYLMSYFSFMITQ